MRRTAAIALLASLLRTGTAAALPPNARITLLPGTDRFLRAPVDLQDVAVEPEGVVSAEILPSKEIYVSAPASAKGFATLLAVGSDRVYAWEVCIRTCPAETHLEDAKAVCPTLEQTTEGGKPVWRVTVKDDKCFDALKAALVHATVPPSELEIVLDEKPALAFFHQVEADIAADPRTKGITAGYYGPTLQLSGEVPRSAVARAVIHAYLDTIGDVSFDDQTSLPDAASDGTAATAVPENSK